MYCWIYSNSTPNTQCWLTFPCCFVTSGLRTSLLLWKADTSLGSFVKGRKWIYLVIWLPDWASHHKEQTLTPDCLFVMMWNAMKESTWYLCLFHGWEPMQNGGFALNLLGRRKDNHLYYEKHIEIWKIFTAEISRLYILQANQSL